MSPLLSAIAPSRATRDDGYTLLEMLVALAIVGMMSGLLLAGIVSGKAETGRLLQAQDSGSATVIAAQSRLRETITRLLPQNVGPSEVDVRGTDHEFAFYAAPQPVDAPDELKRYRLLLTATGDLVLYEANGLDPRIDLNAPELVGWQPITLLHNVVGIDLAYYGRDRLGAGLDWQPSWYNRAQPPQLVRIRIEFAAGDRRRWPELIIGAAASKDAPCTLDAKTGRCAPGQG